MPTEVASSSNIQNILLGMGAVGAAVWAVWERVQKARLSKSSADAGVAVNDAQERMFQLMTQRLESLENDVVRLRGELMEERRHNRALDFRLRQYELHIMKLENIMRSAGLEPPTIVLVSDPVND